jgi:hypothetical protein
MPGRNGYTLRISYDESESRQLGKHKIGVGEQVLISKTDMRRKYTKTSNTSLQKV